MTDDRRLLQELLRLVDRTATHEIDCDEFLHRSAGLAEALASTKVLSVGWSDVLQHLLVCSECAEELEILRRILRDET